MPSTPLNLQEPGILPPELEREIFEFAALSRPVTIPKLMLVAWHVKEWVEPLLYRTIAFEDPIDGYPAFTVDILLSAIRSKPAAFFHDAVRNLNLNHTDVSIEDAVRIVSLCSRLENAVAYGSVLLAGNPHLPLKRATTILRQILDPSDSGTPLSQAHFAHPLLSNLTHLEVWDFLRGSQADDWTGLATLPRLTHLAFNAFIKFPVFKHILEKSSTLEILLLLTPYSPTQATEAGSQDDESFVQDVRFAVMLHSGSTRDWQIGAHGGRDYWKRAEEFVASRRAGRVNYWYIDWAIDE
ncbi:hypothetical protein C8R46DRAFT_1091739 [Mycena filopes]|nr:hypothetical protein C8R46DRAFT_1091739 [Mycena filopes]